MSWELITQTAEVASIMCEHPEVCESPVFPAGSHRPHVGTKIKFKLSKMEWNSKCSFSVALATSQMLTSPHGPRLPCGTERIQSVPGWEEALLGTAFHGLCRMGEGSRGSRGAGRGNRSVLFGLDCHIPESIFHLPEWFLQVWHPRLNIHISVWPGCWVRPLRVLPVL